MPRPFMLGNTTVRSPLRLKQGLEALVTSGFVGNLSRENETAFSWALHEHGVVSLSEETVDHTIGRKWRSAMGKMGFVVPRLDASLLYVEEVLGKQYTITENGQRLLAAESVSAIQEVFLRATAAVQVPSPLETGFDPPPFSPLRHVLRVMLALDAATTSTHITSIEMAVIVQLSTPATSTAEIVARIIDHRERREESVNKKAFDKAELEQAAALSERKPDTVYTYADLNFRYLKATGLVQSKGRGISLVPEQRAMSELLVAQPEQELSDLDYLIQLCRGSELPTDSQYGATVVLKQLADSAEARGISVDFDIAQLTDPGDIAVARHNLEERISMSKEIDFAAEQSGQIAEILAVMQLIITRKERTTVDGEEISVPKGERPAYFEWVVWRAFLAINHLAVPPYEVRRFKIDQDFLPVGNAPGGGADLIVEFNDFVLVVEVTLTENSRQEAAEGEPVRRHVADVVEKHAETGKTVYGLFMANRIDSNAAETFRIGSWYRADDSRLTLDIAPFTLAQFRELVASMFDGGVVHPNAVREVIESAIGLRDESSGAPEWKVKLQELLPVVTPS